MALRIGVDIGGTFTDLVALDETTGSVLNTKALSTPQSLLDGVLRCVDQAGARLADTRLVIHGTTIGINALLEGKGARTGLITTDGFRDVLEIGRGNFLRMYDVLYRRPTPLVPRGRCLEVPERLTARGDVLVPLDEAAVRAAARRLAGEGVQAVALVFLFSYRNPAHEQRAAAILAEEMPGVAVSVSHRLTQEWREYERTSTTVVNAYVLPIVDRYLGAFGTRLGERGFRGRLLITQSNGGAFSLEAARAKPVHTIESGPAAGAVGCAALAAVLGMPRLISFDMGGTTAKCAIVDARHGPDHRRVPRGRPAAAHPGDRHPRGERGRRHHRLDRRRRRADARPAERGRRARPRLLRARRPRADGHRRQRRARPHRRLPLPRRHHAAGRTARPRAPSTTSWPGRSASRGSTPPPASCGSPT